LVFPNTVGKPLSPQNFMSRSFRPLLARAGLPPIRFHDLRHTCATLLLKRGVHAKIVSELLGHASIQVTLDLYSHVVGTMQQASAEAMDALLGGHDGGQAAGSSAVAAGWPS
jgi:integrase